MSDYTVKKREDGRLCIYSKKFGLAVAVFEPGGAADAQAIKDLLEGRESNSLLPAEPKAKAKGTIEELRAYAVDLGLPETDGETLFNKWEGCGWINGGSKIKDWRGTMRSWKAQGYMPSQKTTQNQSYGRARTNSQPPGALNSQNRYRRTGA